MVWLILDGDTLISSFLINTYFIVVMEKRTWGWLSSTDWSTGDSKESFNIGPLESISSHSNLNQWPSEGILIILCAFTCLCSLYMFSYNNFISPTFCNLSFSIHVQWVHDSWGDNIISGVVWLGNSRSFSILETYYWILLWKSPVSFPHCLFLWHTLKRE